MSLTLNLTLISPPALLYEGLQSRAASLLLPTASLVSLYSARSTLPNLVPRNSILNCTLYLVLAIGPSSLPGCPPRRRGGHCEQFRERYVYLVYGAHLGS